MNQETFKEHWEMVGFLVSLGLGMSGLLVQSIGLLAGGFIGMTVLFVLSLMEN